MAKLAFGKRLPETSAYLALGIGALTILVSSYAINASPTFVPVIGYGPGALLWFLAILGLAYVVAKDAGHVFGPRLATTTAALLVAVYLIQLGWRAFGSNESKLDRLPFHTAKRGIICSEKGIALPITEKQSAIALDARERKYWLEALRNWRVNAIQLGSEWRRAPEGSPESRVSPYMISEPISTLARYTLLVEGGYPYINVWSDGGEFVRMYLIDNLNNKELGQLMHRREMNKLLGFCPLLIPRTDSQKTEAVKWLAPFISSGKTD